MFEPISLKQSYNLARLHDNTLTYRRNTPQYSKLPAQANSYQQNPRPAYSTVSNKPTSSPTFTTFKSPQPALLPTPNRPPFNNSMVNPNPRPSRPIRTREMDERRAKGLCFWCDEKFVPGHRCKNRKLYSLCIIEDEEENSEETLETRNEEDLNPHLSLHVLQGTTGCHIVKIWGKLDKCPIFILIDSGSTHNFLNANLASKQNCLLTPIKPMLVEAANGGTMACAKLCKNLQWIMQGVQFQANVFVMALQNYDMVLGI